MNIEKHLRIFAAGVVLSAAACAPTPTPSLPPSPTPRLELTPYQARTITPSAPTLAPGTPTPLPTFTPTPLTHIVTKGQDMFGIALFYGITLDALKTANPEINPNFLSIGTTLIIPSEGRPIPTAVNPTPTPLPVESAPPSCFPSREGGVWCFVAVRNPGPGRLESLSARLRMAGSTGEFVEAIAYSPLNLLEGGAQFALAAYFPSPVPGDYQVNAEIITSLPVPSEDTRYLPARLDQISVEIAADGLSATLSTGAFVDGPTAAQIVWVAVTAYDSTGRVVGIRRWENKQPLAVGERLPISMIVYSVGPTIARIEALVEARP